MDRLISEKQIIDIIKTWATPLQVSNAESMQDLWVEDVCRLVKAIPSADEDEWVKRSDVIRVIDKRVDERLSEPYKGMTNGEVIKAMFPQLMIFEETASKVVWGRSESETKWWNSPYEPQERSE